MNVKSLLLAATALSAVVISGCNSADAIIGNRNPRVKLVNAVGDTNVDAFIDNNAVFDNAGFETVSDESIINNGNHVVTFRNATNDQIITTQTQLFELNKDYVVVGYGPTGANNMIVLSDAATPAIGNSGVRFAHAAGTPDPVDIYVVNANQDIVGDTPLVNNLDSDTASTYQGVVAGSKRVVVTASDNQIPIVDVTFSLEAAKNYTFVVARNVGGARLIRVDDTP